MTFLTEVELDHGTTDVAPAKEVALHIRCRGLMQRAIALLGDDEKYWCKGTWRKEIVSTRFVHGFLPKRERWHAHCAMGALMAADHANFTDEYLHDGRSEAYDVVLTALAKEAARRMGLKDPEYSNKHVIWAYNDSVYGGYANVKNLFETVGKAHGWL